MHYVKDVKYVEGYKLQLTFENGETKGVDLASYLEGEIFKPVKDINYFKTVKVHPDSDTIYWDNGADLAPEFLYSIGK